MSYDDDVALVRNIVARHGPNFMNEVLNDSSKEAELTIISNKGLHPLPYDFIKGEIYVASEGNLDFSSIQSVNKELDAIVMGIKKILFSKRWSRIYLLPFGHSIINMNIKMAVYRLLRIETIDIFYFGNGKYGYVDRDTRSKLLVSE